MEKVNKKIKEFWVIQNNSLPLECINKINKRKNAKQLSTFDFSTLYTNIPHDKLLDILYKVVDFVFKEGTKDCIIINKQGCASWSSKAKVPQCNIFVHMQCNMLHCKRLKKLQSVP